jgi:hypothetical protein
MFDPEDDDYGPSSALARTQRLPSHPTRSAVSEAESDFSFGTEFERVFDMEIGAIGTDKSWEDMRQLLFIPSNTSASWNDPADAGSMSDRRGGGGSAAAAARRMRLYSHPDSSLPPAESDLDQIFDELTDEALAEERFMALRSLNRSRLGSSGMYNTPLCSLMEEYSTEDIGAYYYGASDDDDEVSVRSESYYTRPRTESDGRLKLPPDVPPTCTDCSQAMPLANSIVTRHNQSDDVIYTKSHQYSKYQDCRDDDTAATSLLTYSSLSTAPCSTFSDVLTNTSTQYSLDQNQQHEITTHTSISRHPQHHQNVDDTGSVDTDAILFDIERFFASVKHSSCRPRSIMKKSKSILKVSSYSTSKDNSEVEEDDTNDCSVGTGPVDKTDRSPLNANDQVDTLSMESPQATSRCINSNVLTTTKTSIDQQSTDFDSNDVDCLFGLKTRKLPSVNECVSMNSSHDEERAGNDRDDNHEGCHYNSYHDRENDANRSTNLLERGEQKTGVGISSNRTPFEVIDETSALRMVTTDSGETYTINDRGYLERSIANRCNRYLDSHGPPVVLVPDIDKLIPSTSYLATETFMGKAMLDDSTVERLADKERLIPTSVSGQTPPIESAKFALQSIHFIESTLPSHSQETLPIGNSTGSAEVRAVCITPVSDDNSGVLISSDTRPENNEEMQCTESEGSNCTVLSEPPNTLHSQFSNEDSNNSSVLDKSTSQNSFGSTKDKLDKSTSEDSLGPTKEKESNNEGPPPTSSILNEEPHIIDNKEQSVHTECGIIELEFEVSLDRNNNAQRFSQVDQSTTISGESEQSFYGKPTTQLDSIHDEDSRSSINVETISQQPFDNTMHSEPDTPNAQNGHKEPQLSSPNEDVSCTQSLSLMDFDIHGLCGTIDPFVGDPDRHEASLVNCNNEIESAMGSDWLSPMLLAVNLPSTDHRLMYQYSTVVSSIWKAIECHQPPYNESINDVDELDSETTNILLSVHEMIRSGIPRVQAIGMSILLKQYSTD